MMQIRHGRVELELHALARRDGPTLLLLHALFGSSQDWPDVGSLWPGSVYALDFSGHGQSEAVAGGGYYAELLVADADAALARIGHAAVAGAGLGAYIALLLAGARSELVPAALLLPGAGLSGRGPAPTFAKMFDPSEPLADEPSGPHDPAVRVLDLDVRPPEYAAQFGAAAKCILLAEDGRPRPPWWETLRPIPATRHLANPTLATAMQTLLADSASPVHS